MKLRDELTDFLFDPAFAVNGWVKMLKHSDPVAQWRLRGKLVRFWWQSRNERRHWWECRPTLFGAKWEEYYRSLRAEAEALWKKERWWEANS